MELDEFKKHWSNIQDKEINQQKYTTDKLDHIIMNTTKTLNELQEKSAYWNKLGKTVCTMLIAALLVNVAIGYFIPPKNNTVSQSLLYVAILIGYAFITMWLTQKQEQIFSNHNNGQNLKEALRKTLSDFKRFYIVFNLIYLVVFPAYFYAMIKLFLGFLALSQATIIMICIGGTIVTMIASHLYYLAKYGKKIKELAVNLKELEG